MPCAQIRDLTGHLIDEDRLILVKQLGQGSFGHVYRAIHAACSSKIFAVKVAPLPAPGSRENDFLNREGLIHELLSDHPNIVTMHRKFRTEKHAFMVMDFCDGGDLFDAIDSKVFRGDTALLKHVFVQILDAVAYCHERGVYHRDIKPENILYSSDGMAFLTDFGLSTQSKFSDVFRIGSPYYMSPECLGEGQRALVYLNRPNDIWSLGIVLVNMLTGAYPWSRAWSQDVCYQEYLRDPDILYDIFPISRSATELLKKVFEVEPLGRLAITKFREEVSAVDEF
ncbi:kinase-like protein, partial [Fistulina hepatica ATCC 64428]